MNTQPCALCGQPTYGYHKGVPECPDCMDRLDMAHIVLPDDSTVADHLLPRIEEAYRTGGMPPALLPPTRRAIES